MRNPGPSLLLLYCLFYFYSPLSFTYSLSARATPRRFKKGVEKVRDKFIQWSSDDTSNHPTLLVDGNNLRGIGKFEWNFLELQHHVACFCHDYSITKVIVVWDHGRCPSAFHKVYQSRMDDFSLDMVILFSGISQRADDVLIAESKHLVDLFGPSMVDGSTSLQEDMMLDWSALAFVTQDRELSYKLCRQASLSIERQKLDSRDIAMARCSTAAAPLFCDSTRFLELLRNTTNVVWRQDDSDESISMTLKETKESIMQFHKRQRRGYNPRREKTWERVVQAEVFRACLSREGNAASTVSKGSTFVDSSMVDLETRGYSLTCNKNEPGGLPFVCPARLDKKQRRSLQRYNKFVANIDKE